mmetsp:Transcript_28913/g.49277  ORF Transcript_28913/g.49277 Transcript_28913/m.49277 type:complete len:200 (-) Transcript_28913:2629-3228(-)
MTGLGELQATFRKRAFMLFFIQYADGCPKSELTFGRIGAGFQYGLGGAVRQATAMLCSIVLWISVPSSRKKPLPWLTNPVLFLILTSWLPWTVYHRLNDSQQEPFRISIPLPNLPAAPSGRYAEKLWAAPLRWQCSGYRPMDPKFPGCPSRHSSTPSKTAPDPYRNIVCPPKMELGPCNPVVPYSQWPLGLGGAAPSPQ